MAGQANGDTPEAVFDFFMSCNAMQDILESFERLKASLGLAGRARLELFRGFQENLRSWKCSSLWAELDKRANQKVSWDTPTSNGPLCYLTPCARACCVAAGRSAVECKGGGGNALVSHSTALREWIGCGRHHCASDWWWPLRPAHGH